MRRLSASALLIAALVGVGLVGCAPAAEAPVSPASTQEPSSEEASQAPGTPDASDEEKPDAETPGAGGVQGANELCAAESVADDADVCVLENATSTADLDFTAFKVVKLIGGSFEGKVSVGGSAQQVVITEATFASDVTLNARGGAVVKLSSIAGTLNFAGGHGATVVKNTVGGDLLCAGGVQANGSGNSVTGKSTGTCSRVA